ncbi:unnamed protein product [Ambrosiozyma monospora]|uniref:Unnamed protein product n=1 Tax=Ambrosiozyma monospora TaxID=43982 RepID=A0ACB5T252_AMBMO|nr:unnamed protein product [Ambrosiozyma monospora]
MVQHCDEHNLKFETTVANLKKSQRGRKLSKNSNGLNNPSINYYFDSNMRSQHQQQIQRQQQQMLSIPVETDEFTGEPRISPELTTFATNWSIGSLNEHQLQQQRSSQQIQQTTSSASLRRLSSSRHRGSLQPTNSLIPQQSTQSMNNGAISASVDEVVLQDTTEGPKDFFVEEIRTLCAGDLKSGWKSDFSGKGRIETVAEISIMDLVTNGLNSNMNNLTLINSVNCNSPIFDVDMSNTQNETNCSCDIEDNELGIFVNHNLIVEVVVAEELVQTTLNAQKKPAPPHHNNIPRSAALNTQVPIATNLSPTATHSSSNPSSTHSTPRLGPTVGSVSAPPPGHSDGGTGPDHLNGNKSDPVNHTIGIPTGVARVLRMQFKLIITERSGLGVAWDDEVPPTYTSVGALSPPTYDVATSGANTPMLSSTLSVIPLDSIDATLSNGELNGRGDGGISNDLDQVVLGELTPPPVAKLHYRHDSRDNDSS